MTFFREILTVLAGLMVVVLAALLAVPWFVDWNTHRPLIVETLATATGGDIRVDGDIDLRLLPSPRLRLGRVTVTGAGSASPRLEAGALRMELGLTDLLRGRIRFIDAEFEQLRLYTTMDGDGGLAIPALERRHADQVAFERIAVRDGQIIVARGEAEPLRLDGFELSARVQSLAGPFRGAGQLRIDGRDIEYSFNTGVADDAGLRIKLAVGAGAALRGEFDGMLRWSVRAGGRLVPHFDGGAVLSGSLAPPGGAAQPWRLAGPLVASPERARLEPAELTAGGEDQSLSASGAFDAMFGGQPQFELSLTAQQIDIDRLFGEGDGPALAMERFAASLTRLLTADGWARMSAAPTLLEVTTPAMTIGGETMTEVALGLRLFPDRPAALRLRASGPGGASIALDGALETGIAPVFRGEAQFGVRDMRRLEGWLGGGAPQLARVAAALPYRALRGRGRADISGAGVAGRDLVIETGRSQFEGAIVFRRAVGGERASLHVDLTSPALDLDGLGDLGAPARELADSDLFIALDARAVRLAQFGSGMLDAGRIEARLERRGGLLTLHRFEVANLGGASLSVSGTLGERTGQAKARIDAENLVQLSQALQRVAPGPWTQALAERAASLSPARLDIAATGARGGAGGALALTGLDVAGKVRDTAISGSATPGKEGGLAAGKLTLAAPQAAYLLRQLGLDAVPVSGAGPGSAEFVWGGASADAVEAAARAEFAGTTVQFAGRVRSLLPDPDIRGRLAVAGEDAGPLLRILALGAPDALQRAPVNLSADFAWRGRRISAGDLNGSALGVRVAGALALAPREGAAAGGRPAGGYETSGQLRLDAIALREIAGLVLGPAGPAKDDLWSRQEFARTQTPLPPGRIRIDAGEAALPGGVAGRSAQFTLALGQGGLAFEDFSVRVGEGRIEGAIAIRKDGSTAAVSGRLGFEAPRLGFGNVAAQMRGSLEFAGSGSSEFALISGLAGRGVVEARELTIARANPRALTETLAATDRQQLDVNEFEVVEALRKAFAQGPLVYADKSLQVAVAGGVARIDGGSDDLPGGVRGALGGSLDLRTLAGDVRLDLTAQERPADWDGPPPQVELTMPLHDRDAEPAISASTFVNGLSARAIMREAARVEALEFDIRERAYFNRREKARQFLERRQVELATFRTEQARKAEEARRKLEEEARSRREEEEEARRKAEEARRQAAEAAERKAVEEASKVEAERREAEEARRRAEAEQASQRALAPEASDQPASGAAWPGVISREFERIERERQMLREQLRLPEAAAQ